MYWNIFVNNILPVFLCAGAGFALGRRLNPDTRTASRLAFYIFSPCLVFNSIARSELSGREFGQMAFFTLTVSALISLVALGLGWLMRLPRPQLSALIVASVFGNVGNYGLAVTQFAFGDQALARAVIYYVFSTLTVYTLGVVVASLGSRPPLQAFKELLTLPAAYAMAGAGVFRVAGWAIPTALERALGLLSQAALPVMLVLLGLQLANVRTWPRSRLGLMVVASGLQLLLAPLVGLALAGLFGLTGVARQAAILESAMPTAVITTILAVEYDLDATFVTGVVLLSTLLSPFSLTPLIAYLR